MKYQQNNKGTKLSLKKELLLLYHHTITKSWFKNPQPCYIIVRIPFEKKSQCYVHNQISYNEKQVEKGEWVRESDRVRK